MSIPPPSDREYWSAFVGLLLLTMMCLAAGVTLSMGDPRPN